ncbi:MAG: amidohydrolase family protein [Actinomycetia bacterium]|nr:amidohydrolase family protein [Actinomycetes bacterium]
MTLRVAVSQAPYAREVETCLPRALDHMRQARRLGADLVVFPEWFLGLNPLETFPGRPLRILADAARELSLGVVTGSLRAIDPVSGHKQQRAAVIDPGGRIVGSQAKCAFYAAERPWFDPAEGVVPIDSVFGRIVILLGLDALDPVRWEEARRAAPDLVVMATSARTPRERAALQDRALARSLEIGGTVVLAPLQGRFGGAAYVGGALVAHRGRALTAPTDAPGVIVPGPSGAALIHLGVVDATHGWPLARVDADAAAPLAPAGDPEPERRVLLDWDLLTVADPLAASRRLLAEAREVPRAAALAPARPDAPEVLATLLAEGARGAFADPARAGRPAWDAAWEPVVRLAAQAGRPLFVHAGPGPGPLRLAHPQDWDDWVLAESRLTVVVVSAGRAGPFLEETLLWASTRDRVYLETSHVPVEFLRDAVAALGPGRLVFGSGGGPPRFREEYQKLLRLREAAGLDDEAFARIAGTTARRLLLDDEPAAAALSPARPRDPRLGRPTGP